MAKSKTKWFYYSEYLGIAEFVLVNFAKCIEHNENSCILGLSEDSPVEDIIEQIEIIIDSSRDYTYVMLRVKNYLSSLGVKDRVRHQYRSGLKGCYYTTIEDFAQKYYEYFTGISGSGKKNKTDLDLNDLDLPIGYHPEELTDLENMLKDRRSENGIIPDYVKYSLPTVSVGVGYQPVNNGIKIYY